jgi:hypothetical protein
MSREVLRSNYVGLVRAVRMMVLAGGECQLVGRCDEQVRRSLQSDKGSNDRMLAEMAPRQLSPRDPGVRIITLYSGAVRTEKLEACGAETLAMAGRGARKDECAGLIPLEALEKLGWNF